MRSPDRIIVLSVTHPGHPGPEAHGRRQPLALGPVLHSLLIGLRSGTARRGCFAEPAPGCSASRWAWAPCAGRGSRAQLFLESRLGFFLPVERPDVVAVAAAVDEGAPGFVVGVETDALEPAFGIAADAVVLSGLLLGDVARLARRQSNVEWLRKMVLAGRWLHDPAVHVAEAVLAIHLDLADGIASVAALAAVAPLEVGK